MVGETTEIVKGEEVGKTGKRIGARETEEERNGDLWRGPGPGPALPRGTVARALSVIGCRLATLVNWR
jgi:hypothetical protein